MGRPSEDNTARRIGKGVVIQTTARRSRSMSESVLTFFAIPSLLLWTLTFLFIGGDIRGAVQFACAAVSGGFLGWCLCELR